ncbi:hypothetical protein [Massilia arenae]|uniref:Uncharacterized protein n=1 Tax=Massilia arenae TaxID=2603288 RepID=A0A5C7FNM3_9BURK|nr:hypothetical protein [Massilia arenae]TXF97168.1 hypothetical protein FVD38_21930 [Massilia arenae]
METRNDIVTANDQHDGHHAPGEHDGEGHVGHVHGAIAPRRPTRDQLQHIQGWGADLDRKNRPGVPMERTPPRFINVPDGDPVPQEQRVEVLVSTERPGRTPLFGTVQPPSGLSGAIRRLAFKSTENDVRHWLLLLLADRVNVVEGIGDDLAKGKVPNILAEMGIKSEFKHNPAGLAKKVAIGAAVVGVACYLMKRRDRR